MTQPDKIKNLQDYFVQVRKRPVMYIGENTISKLYDHLQGYRISFWFNDIENPIDKNFFDNFNEFVYRYYGVTTNDNWKGVILEQSFGNEQNALETFFKLFDLFISDNVKLTDSKKVVLAFFDKLIFRKDEIETKLGNDFTTILNDTTDLIMENALSILKYDYNWILEQLKERSENIPELKNELVKLEKEHTS